MRAESAAYAAERAADATSPQLFVRLLFVRKRLDNVEYPYSRDLASHAIRNAERPAIACVRSVSPYSVRVDPIAGATTIGAVTVELVDRGREIQRMVANPQQVLRTSIAAADEPATVDVPDASAYASRGTVSLITAGGVEDFAYTGRDTAAKQLTGVRRGVRGTSRLDHRAGETVVHNGERLRIGIRAALYLGYAALDASEYGPAGGFLKGEIATVAAAQAGQIWTLTIQDVQRYTRKKIFSGATEENPVTLAQEHPLDLYLRVATSTGDATNGPYDTLAKANGAAIPQILVDVPAILAERARRPSLLMEFKENAPAEVRAFLDGQILRPLNLATSVTQLGKLSVRSLQYDDAGAPTLTDADILSSPETGLPLAEWTPYTTIRNRLDVYYDHNVAALRPNDFGRRQVWTADQGADDSVDLYGLQPSVSMAFRGVKESLGGQALLDDLAKAFLNRWAYPPPTLTVAAKYRWHRLEMLDSLRITHALIKHPVKGTSGITAEKFVVIGASTAFLTTGKIQLQLLWMGDAETRPSPSASGAAALVPATPANLAIAENSSDVSPGGPLLPFFRMSWTAGVEANLLRYDLRWRIQGTNAYQSMEVAKSETTAKLIPLRANTTYEVEIRAVTTSNAVSPWSATVLGTTVQDTAPATPTGLTLVASSEQGPDGTFLGVLEADWGDNAEADLAGYRVRYREDGSAGPYTTTDIGRAESRTRLRGLKPNTAYDVSVAAYDGAGNASAFSAEVTATTAAGPANPSVPTGLATVSLPLAVAITWTVNPESDIEHYELQRAADAAFTAPATLVKAKVTAYLDETADTTTRWYRVRARRRSGNESDWTAGVSGAGAQVGDGNIAALTVTKLTAGTLSVIVDLIVGGILRTAASGARVEIDSTGIREYDGSGLVAELKNDGTFTFGPASGARVVVTKNALEIFDSGGASVLKLQNSDPFARIGKDDGTAIKLSSAGALIAFITSQIGTGAITNAVSRMNDSGNMPTAGAPAYFLPPPGSGLVVEITTDNTTYPLEAKATVTISNGAGANRYTGKVRLFRNVGSPVELAAYNLDLAAGASETITLVGKLDFPSVATHQFRVEMETITAGGNSPTFAGGHVQLSQRRR